MQVCGFEIDHMLLQSLEKFGHSAEKDEPIAQTSAELSPQNLGGYVDSPK